MKNEIEQLGSEAEFSPETSENSSQETSIEEVEKTYANAGIQWEEFQKNAEFLNASLPTAELQQAATKLKEQADLAFRNLFKGSMGIIGMPAISDLGIGVQKKYEEYKKESEKYDFLTALKVYAQFIYHYNTRVNGQMSAEEIAFREYIADNFRPAEYGPSTIIEGLKNYREGDGEWSKEAVEKRGKYQEIVNRALFRKYLGLPAENDLIVPSEYKPSKATNPDQEYVAFPKEHMIKGMLENMKPREWEAGQHTEGVKDYIKEWEGKGVDLYHPEPKAIYTWENLKGTKEPITENKQLSLPAVNEYTYQMGRFISYIGYDKERNEEYYSYYDVWDLDPPDFEKYNLDIDKYNFQFEIYDRIYKSDFEKVTNELIENKQLDLDLKYKK